ncbi:hypothetical protein UVI_02009260 [Ustilaginoidea virens]|uniref:Uncharacterized protein n=1 Tax=Ustilaginoidea virens TaxID=1159556 RepID=A0A1B5KX18_USTVR|nr:hypothetical protein UVI_02009260 [Ustilaginoidea virens]
MAKFDWLTSVGATREAVAVLNDQPNLLVDLVLVLIGLGLQCLLVWYIHYATMKPEQKEKRRKPATDNPIGAQGRT